MSIVEAVSAAPPGWVEVVLTSAVVAALVAFLQNLWVERHKTREAERNRLRQSFAQAFAAYSEYKELPYAIRRRRPDGDVEERARLSAEIQALQSKLSYYLAWTQFESPTVGAAYRELLQKMRQVAGASIREAWEQSPAGTDAEMNISIDTVDLRPLGSEEDRYISAVTARLDAITPRVARRR